MSVWQGIALGLLQGIAEFLPISSSGHLAVAKELFGLEAPLLFDVFLHLATLLAVVLFFRRKIASLVVSLVALIIRKKNLTAEQSAKRDQDGQYILSVILATVVTGVIGVLTAKLLDDDKISVKVVCAGFVFTAFLLITSSIVARRAAKHTASHSGEQVAPASPSWKQALIIGFAQGIGTLPGVSRSGSTISASLFCGVTRDVAGEFSFIVSIPAVLGAFLLEIKDIGDVAQSVGAAPVLAGCIAAFASGLCALSALMRLVKKGRLEWFAIYLVPLGVLGMIFLG